MGGLNTAAIIHLSQSSYPFLGELNELIVPPHARILRPRSLDDIDDTIEELKAEFNRHTPIISGSLSFATPLYPRSKQTLLFSGVRTTVAHAESAIWTHDRKFPYYRSPPTSLITRLTAIRVRKSAKIPKRQKKGRESCPPSTPKNKPTTRYPLSPIAPQSITPILWACPCKTEISPTKERNEPPGVVSRKELDWAFGPYDTRVDSDNIYLKIE